MKSFDTHLSFGGKQVVTSTRTDLELQFNSVVTI